jgi:hypothetical protein
LSADGDVESRLQESVSGGQSWVPIIHQGCHFSEELRESLLTVMGWYLALVVALILPYVLAHFDYTHWDVIGGLLVLSLYVAVVVALAVLLVRSGRRLRAK